MLSKPLVETNPYLRDPEQRRALIYTAVTSSTAIETGYIVSNETAPLDSVSNKIFTVAESEETYQ